MSFAVLFLFSNAQNWVYFESEWILCILIGFLKRVLTFTKLYYTGLKAAREYANLENIMVLDTEIV